MRSLFNVTAEQQKREQAERLMTIARRKHVKAVELAKAIDAAVLSQVDWDLHWTAEDYLGRLGVVIE